MVNAYVRFDNSGHAWNFCDDDAVNNEHDLWSVIMHEIGHLMFLNDMVNGGEGIYVGNFPPTDTLDGRCVNNGDQPTMCGINYVNTERQRVLEPEDVNSVNKAY